MPEVVVAVFSEYGCDTHVMRNNRILKVPRFRKIDLFSEAGRQRACSARGARWPCWQLVVLASVACYATNVQAQFGLKCDSSAFDDSLTTLKFSDDIQAAIRATCAFNKKNAEMHAVFAKSGWSWDLLPKARADVAELTALANTAAELNFKTSDPRGLGNIKNMYLRVGDQQRWLADQENKFVARGQALARQSQSVSADPSQTAASPMFVFVVFQDDISNADKEAFLQAYSVSIVDGPNADQSYRLRLEAQLPQDQLQLVLNSMNTQTKVVKLAFAK